MSNDANEKKFLKYLKLTNIYKNTAELNDLTQEQLDDINDSSILKNICLKRELSKHTKKINKKTFIIPVEDGAITGYLFENNTKQDQGSITPLIIFFHGGGWIWGNIEFYSYYCSRLSAETGARILFVDYRLSPRYKFPTAIEDCYSTLEWACAGSRYWRVDPDRIFLMGDGAGGNLSIVVSRLARDRKGPNIAGQILFYPLTDARMRTNSYEKYSTTPAIDKAEIAYYVNQYMNEPKDILDPMFSPLLGKDHSRLPSTLIICAEKDPLRDDGLLYADALASADSPTKYLEVEGVYHGFAAFPNVKGSDETLSAVTQFLSGRNIKNIVLKTQKEIKREKKEEIRMKKNKSKSSLEIL
jgi:acetyl esterase